MKKIYTLIACLLLAGTTLKAQDTLLFEDFELANFYNTLDSVDVLPGNTADPLWYQCDMDMIPDGSSTGTRPNGWFAMSPFSDVDAYETGYFDGLGNPDTNTVISSNSWNNNGEGAGGAESNWLVTPSVHIYLHDTLFFKAAPSQTPRYMDGYEVLLSTTTNEDLSFTNILFTAAENTALGSDTTYSTFGFSTAAAGPAAFVHGEDGLFIDCACGGNSHRGQLRSFSVPLDAFAGQDVYIGFHHNSHDDNLVELDDVMIRGYSLFTSVKENSKNDLAINVWPNPATDNAQLNFTLTAETNVSISVNDIAGKTVYSDNKGSLSHGRHFANIKTSALAKGFYTVTIQTNDNRVTTKLIVK